MLRLMYNDEIICYVEGANEEYVKNASEEERREYADYYINDSMLSIAHKGEWIHHGFTFEYCENVKVNNKYNGTYEPLYFEEATLETELKDCTYYDRIKTSDFIIEIIYDVHEYEDFELLDI